MNVLRASRMPALLLLLGLGGAKAGVGEQSLPEAMNCDAPRSASSRSRPPGARGSGVHRYLWELAPPPPRPPPGHDLALLVWAAGPPPPSPPPSSPPSSRPPLASPHATPMYKCEQCVGYEHYGYELLGSRAAPLSPSCCTSTLVWMWRWQGGVGQYPLPEARGFMPLPSSSPSPERSKRSRSNATGML